MSVPPCATREAIARASGTSTRLSMLASTIGNSALTSPTGFFATRKRFATPLAAAFSRDASIDSSSMSTPCALAAPKRSAPMARMPLPQPTSSTVSPPRTIFSSSASTRRVVSCVPVPKAWPGSIVRTTSPSRGSTGSHDGRTSKRDPTRVGLKNSRHRCFQSSPTIGTRRAGNGAASTTMRARSSSSKCATNVTVPSAPVLSRVVASRSSTPEAPSAKSIAATSAV